MGGCRGRDSAWWSVFWRVCGTVGADGVGQSRDIQVRFEGLRDNP